MSHQFYELTSLSMPLPIAAEASAAVWSWTQAAEAVGVPLGCWRTELGALGQVLILRGFADAGALAAERRRALLSANPFNAAGSATHFEMRGYAPFPFLPPVTPRVLGGTYEFRTYRLKVGGLPPTLAGWEAAVGPARALTEHLVINMYALDGEPQVTHIWGYESLEQRAQLRASAFGAGLWPPKGGPENIREAVSTIALADAHSPLR